MNILFATPYFKMETPNDWETKKQLLIDKLVELNTLEKRSGENFESSRNVDEEKMIMLKNYFIEVMGSSLYPFLAEIGEAEADIKNIWAVTYSKGDYHDVHNHAVHGVSGILYLDFDPNEHPATTYVGSNNFVTNQTELSVPPVKEGEIVLIPSHILHYTRPNLSERQKTIISFDMQVGKDH